jgi:hypothetical protein
MILWRRRGLTLLDAWRRKLIRETEAALLAGLLHPNQSPRIPTVIVGTDRFDPKWSRCWWDRVLELEPDPGPQNS